METQRRTLPIGKELTTPWRRLRSVCYNLLQVSQFILPTYSTILTVALASEHYHRPEFHHRRASILASLWNYEVSECFPIVKNGGSRLDITIYPKFIEEPRFECVRLRRTHSKRELLLNFRIGLRITRYKSYAIIS